MTDILFKANAEILYYCMPLHSPLFDLLGWLTTFDNPFLLKGSPDMTQMTGCPASRTPSNELASVRLLERVQFHRSATKGEINHYTVSTKINGLSA